MSYVKCNTCGRDIEATLATCPYCGQPVNAVETEEYDFGPEYYPRNGFVSFWLWACLICNGLMAVAYFFTIFSDRGLWSAYDPMWTRVYGFVASALLAVGYWMILKWKVLGFYLACAIAAVNFLMNFTGGASITVSTFMPLISILLLFAILQIRSDGKSCWSLLS